MKVRRIVSNTATPDLAKAKAFYSDILGLDLLMDHGWFRTYGSDATMTVQVSARPAGSSTSCSTIEASAYTRTMSYCSWL
jgi:catechol 2,3-dioxygenase-like lactoylglutathione lyase family enzyme